MFFIFYITSLTAFTTRDLKPEPEYNPEKIKKLVILHLNLERVNNGKPAFIINKNLNSAAKWHSDYMSEKGKLFHITSEKGKHDILQRVTFYGEKVSSYAEIISSACSLNVDGKKLLKKKDDEGEYIDFGNTQVLWLTETEIAMLIMRNILNDPAYIKYLQYEPFNSIGGGISPGNQDCLKTWYGSFAFVEKKDIIKLKLKMIFKKQTVLKKTNGKDKEEIIVKYNVSGLTGGKAAVLAVGRSGSFKAFNFMVSNGQLEFLIDDEFREKLMDDDRLYVATYDEENDAYYPVFRVEVIK
jgi:hypothetical protein